MYGKFQEHLQAELASIKEAGLYKNERNIASAQSAEITLQDGSKALNFCANNYLGLADSPRLIEAAKKAMDERGFGMSSVRFIAEPRIFTRSLRLPSPTSSTQRTPSSTHHASMPTVGCSSLCSRLTTPSSQIP